MLLKVRTGPDQTVFVTRMFSFAVCVHRLDTSRGRYKEGEKRFGPPNLSCLLSVGCDINVKQGKGRAPNLYSLRRCVWCVCVKGWPSFSSLTWIFMFVCDLSAYIVVLLVPSW